MPAVNDSKFYVTGGWDAVPHIDEKTKAELTANTPPHLRAARMNGEPSLGAGAVYPISPDDFRCQPFVIPAHFRRGYGFDVGWNRTAAVWGAYDVDSDVLYLVSEHYLGQREPSVHADAIKARGQWQPGFIDPASQGAGQMDGKRILDEYRRFGLKLQLADNAVEAGILEIYQRLSTGRMRVFSTLQNWFDEYRFYIRAEKTGKIVKQNDHCLHPDTIVLTDKGPEKIRNLVGTAGRVLSIGGRYEAYRNCRMTASDQEIVEVAFSDGSLVRCTPDHRFLTPKGWVEAMDLDGSLCYREVSRSIGSKNPCQSIPYRGPSKSFGAKDTGYVASIFSGMGAAFMSLFGLPITAANPQKASTSTIRMGIERTISRTTSNYSALVNICRTTTRESAPPSLPRHWRKLLNGIAPTPAVYGILNITACVPTRSTLREILSAISAACNSLRRSQGQTAFARTGAKPSTDSCQGSMTLSVPAPSVTQHSWSTDTAKPEHAGASAKMLRCLRVSAAGRSDVYCLTVPTTEAFAVDGGVIVHNCMDATRYLALAIPKMIVKPIDNNLSGAPARALDTSVGY